MSFATIRYDYLSIVCAIFTYLDWCENKISHHYSPVKCLFWVNVWSKFNYEVRFSWFNLNFQLWHHEIRLSCLRMSHMRNTTFCQSLKGRIQIISNTNWKWKKNRLPLVEVVKFICTTSLYHRSLYGSQYRYSVTNYPYIL